MAGRLSLFIDRQASLATRGFRKGVEDPAWRPRDDGDRSVPPSCEKVPARPAGTPIEDVRYLIAFAKIAETGSFSAGAKALGLSTAATSQYVSKLERSLGIPLFYRSTRRLSLTFEGAQVLQTAQEMLRLYQDGIVQLQGRPSASRKLRITIPAVLVRSQLMAGIASFIHDNPDLDISVSCSDTRYDIIGESFDLAFRIGELPDSSRKARQIFGFAARSAKAFAAENAWRMRTPEPL